MDRNPNEIVDELLVMRSQDGDKAAWRQLVKRWQPRLYALARRLTTHHEGAADVTQETWIAIMKSIHRLEDASRFRPWAHRIVANKSADWIRRQQRERKVHQVDDLNPEADDTTTEARVQRQESIAMLRKAISHLPREHRHLLSMFYIEQMSLIEIADVLEIPVGTVKSRLHSIRRELKLSFGGSDDE